jgi:hypothetical protein
VEGGLLGQSVGGGSGVHRLHDFGLLPLSSASFLSFSHCLATTCRATRLLDYAAWASDIISFLTLSRMVSAVAVVWAS